jgi:hypothetical protein
MTALLLLLLALFAPQDSTADPNAAPSAPTRPKLNLRLFQGDDRPVTGQWTLALKGMPDRVIDIAYLQEGNPNALVGKDVATKEEVLRLDRKTEGIGFTGHLQKVLLSCGVEQVPVTEFVPIGDAIVVNFLARPTEAACPPFDEEGGGHFEIVSHGGGPVKLRNLNDLSSQRIKTEYNLGGDAEGRNTTATEVTSSVPLGGSLSVDPGTEVHFVRRLRAPLDGTYWFEVAVPLAGGQEGMEPPRGFLKAESLQFVGSVTLKRARKE